MIPKNWQYSRGDIYYVNMEPHVGSEQGGERPVVVLQNDTGNKYSPTLIIATLHPGWTKSAICLPTSCLTTTRGLKSHLSYNWNRFSPSTNNVFSGLLAAPVRKK